MMAERAIAATDLIPWTIEVGPDGSLRLVLPTPPSKKTSQRIVARPDGRPFLVASAAARKAEKSIRTLVASRLAKPLFATDDVAVDLTHHVRRDVIEVVVSRLGPRGKGATGRSRDLVNIAEVVLDALQARDLGLGRGPGAYHNDNQVAHLVLRRRLR
jgi:hypothetical protein